jgi:Protein of unknown function (DUF692)
MTMKRLAMRSAAQPSAFLRFPAHSIAGRAGTSLKHEHLQAIWADEKRVGFFEVHAENYMGADGLPHAALNQIHATRLGFHPSGAAGRHCIDTSPSSAGRPLTFCSGHYFY